MTTLTVAAVSLAFMTGLLLQGASADLASLALAGAVGAALVFLGFAAASRVRTLPRRVAAERGRLAVFSLVAGTAVGLANLAANWAIASSDPALRALLTERMATLAPSNAVIASPLALHSYHLDARPGNDATLTNRRTDRLARRRWSPSA